MNPENWQEKQLPKVEWQEGQLDVTEKDQQNVDNIEDKNNQNFANEMKEQNYQQDAKKLFDFMKDRSKSWNSSYYFEWIQTVKDNDMGDKITDFTEPQISSLIDEYNQNNSKVTINKETFLATFREKKEKITPKSLEASTSFIKDNIQEGQEVSKFVLSSEQAQKIQESFSKVIDQKYEISRIKLIGKASGDMVTDKWRTLAKESIDKFLVDLQSKWFDISQLPTYDKIKDQPWFNKEQEDQNPGNYAWAYGRALMQLTALSGDQLKTLSGIKIDFDINSNDTKGNEFTWGWIDFYWQASAKLTVPIIKEKNEILRQWTDIRFKITNGQNNDVDGINIMKDFDAKIDKNSSQNWVFHIPPAIKSWQNFAREERGRTPGKALLSRNSTTWGFQVLVNLNKEQALKYKEKLSNPDTLSFLDYCQIYTDVNGKIDPSLEDLKDKYLAYEKLQNEINEKVKEKKLN